jgi:hypothetical protein
MYDGGMFCKFKKCLMDLSLHVSMLIPLMISFHVVGLMLIYMFHVTMPMKLKHISYDSLSCKSWPTPSHHTKQIQVLIKTNTRTLCNHLSLISKIHVF